MTESRDGAGPGPQTTDSMRRLAYFSFLGGASRLIPVPVVDDWALDYVRRRMFGALLGAAGMSADRSEIKLLTDGQRPSWYRRGCLYLLALPVKAVWYFVGKLFRKVLFFLALKSAADQAVTVFCEGYLLAHAVKSRWLTQSRIEDRPFLLWVHWAIADTLSAADPRFLRTAMRRVFKRSREELSEAAAGLERAGHDKNRSDQDPATPPALPDEPSRLRKTTDAILSVFSSDPEFLRQLEINVEARLPNSGQTPAER